MNFGNCAKLLKDPIIPVSESGRKFTINNSRRDHIKKVEVDGCLFSKTDTRIRCDYLFEIGENCKCVIYVELKGSDIGHAIEQLISTMNHLKSVHGQILRICYIVASRVPKAGPKVQNLKLKMVKDHKALLHVVTNKAEVDVNLPPFCNQ